jgi:hypothetical protein
MSTSGLRWNADQCELERATAARSPFAPTINDMSPSTAIRLTSALLASAIAVVVFAAPPVAATVGAVGTVLIHFTGTIVTYVSRQGVARAG